MFRTWKGLALGVVIGTVTVGVLMTLVGIGIPPSPQIEAYFTAPGTTRDVDDNPEESLYVPTFQDLGEGDELLIAVFSFTDDQIRDAVLEAHNNGADVQVIQDDSRTCRRGAEAERLASAGIPYRVHDDSGLFHHKFAVLNGDTVITGSYNWSDAADTRNFENTVKIQGAETAAEFTEHFEWIWLTGEAFVGCSTSDEEGGDDDDESDKTVGCADDQINVNMASSEQLQEIIHIGPSRAEQIIELRPFDSLDDLTQVNGIASERLEDIKEQGLACVE